MGRGFLMLIVMQAVAYYLRLNEKPPVTTALIALMTLVHFSPTFLHDLPTLDRVLFNPNLIIMDKDMKRFFLSAFYHLGEAHLVHNMVSLLWRGRHLEEYMGSVDYISLLAVLLFMSQAIELLLAKLFLLFNRKRAYYGEFSAGFSGVLFAMNVILYSQSNSHVSIYGISVPSRYAAWVELIIMQVLFPSVSLLGHLGGILAGILYSYMRYAYYGPDPLVPSVSFCGHIGWVLAALLLYSYLESSHYARNQHVQVIKGLVRKLCWPLRYLAGKFKSSRKRFFGGGIVGTRQASNSSVAWRCSVCTYINLRLVSKCEMCESKRGVESEMDTGSRTETLRETERGGITQTERGGNDELGAGSEYHLSVEELRRRRLERYTRRR